MITVKNIMTKEVVIIPKNSNLVDAAELMVSKSVSSLPVVVESDKPVAIITEADIIRGVISKKKNVNDVMNKDFKVISPQTKFSEISKSIREGKIKRFIVMDDNKLVGIVTETDVIEATRDFTRFHQILQEIILTIFGLATAFFLFYFSPIGAMVFR